MSFLSICKKVFSLESYILSAYPLLVYFLFQQKRKGKKKKPFHSNENVTNEGQRLYFHIPFQFKGEVKEFILFVYLRL